MGTTSARLVESEGLSPGDALFTSTQQKVLSLLFGQSERSFYASELIRLAGAGSGAVQREIVRLVASGLVTTRSVGNQRHFQANPDSPIFDELRAITDKTFGLAEPLRKALSKFPGRIRGAFVYGSVAKRQDTAGSDVDLMVIAEKLPYGELVKVLEEATLAIGRQVNPTVFSAAEFSRRRKQSDSFINRVLARPKIWLVGDARVLPA